MWSKEVKRSQQEQNNVISLICIVLYLVNIVNNISDQDHIQINDNALNMVKRSQGINDNRI